MSENQYILLTKNNSHKRIKVYIYNEGDFLNWISRYTFYVEPGHKRLYQNDGPYKYQVSSNKLNDVVLLKRNIKLKVGSTGCVNTYLLCDDELKETNQAIAIRTAKEDETNNNVDYFKLLGLERTITKSDKEEKDFQKKLKTNYHEMIRKYHPDLNPDPTGNNERVTKEVILAYDILSDKYKRARYINLMDSASWWYKLKSIYWPEPTTLEEEKDRWSNLAERFSYSFVSVGLLFGGITTLGCPWLGLAAPIGGMALIGGALQGGMRSLREKCTLKELACSTGLGMAAGAATGGVTGLATAAMAGASSAALTVGQQAGLGAITGFTNGACSSVAINVEKVKLDGEAVSGKTYVNDFFLGGALGAGVGAAGGAVAGKINLAATQYLDEAAEMAFLFNMKNGFKVLEKGGKFIVERVVAKIGETPIKYIKEQIEEGD